MSTLMIMKEKIWKQMAERTTGIYTKDRYDMSIIIMRNNIVKRYMFKKAKNIIANNYLPNVCIN